MRPLSPKNDPFTTAIVCGCLVALTLIALSCAGNTKPPLQDRLHAMGDDELIAYYQGIDARLRAVGEGVRQERAASGGWQPSDHFQQTYFFGGEGNRLLQQRQAAQKELLRREIPRSLWDSPTD
jgi:hypothetical protein